MLEGNNMTPPNQLFLLVKSIGLAAMDATVKPGSLQPWVDEVEEYVNINGKFSKSQVVYAPFSPPPAFWDYKCKKCRWWQEPNGCKVVEGDISPGGWCAIWMPPSSYKAFTWPQELVRGQW